MGRANLLAGALLLLYPLLVYLSVVSGRGEWLPLLLLPLFAIRLIAGSAMPPAWQWVTRWLGAIGLLLVGLNLWFREHDWLLYYPLAVNATLLALFGASLRQPMTLVERLARLSTPDLPEQGIRYTRKVTQVWCLFFIANGALSAWTIWQGNLALWSLYNGLVSYLLMGALMGGEWLVRQRVMRRGEP
ncbi:hypothetical protein ACKC5O_11345 [Aeromonas schubertii]|uniref:DNA gyrase subunit B n=1 Tax=Aeromonas schubertii TaxID=652 RepID=A0ABS7VBI7_9GAMM|nr:hypothetical protein [Aeromonas schubertii]MBZ6066754.1 hypothetical protein [Aeromonas schubertii]MBZ6072203.1 hypothetical protein [Aeromonas schubertii]